MVPQAPSRSPRGEIQTEILQTLQALLLCVVYLIYCLVSRE